MPTVTVIIPVYNCARWIERCAASVLGQTHDDLDVVWVDDCSPDNSVELLEQEIARHPGFAGTSRILRHPENRGSAAARTTGLDAAQGDWVIQVDADDWVAPDFVEVLLAHAVATGSDVVACDIMRVTRQGNQLDREPVPASRELALAHLLAGTMHGSLCNKLISRQLIERHHLRPLAGLNILEDKSMVYKVFYHAAKITHVPRALYFYNKLNDESYTAHAQDINATVARYQAGYFALLADMRQWQQSHACTPVVTRGFAHFAAFVTSLFLLHGDTALLRQHRDLFAGLTLADILSQPKLPPHHKLAILSHRYGAGLAVRLLRVAERLHNRVRYRRHAHGRGA